MDDANKWNCETIWPENQIIDSQSLLDVHNILLIHCPQCPFFTFNYNRLLGHLSQSNHSSTLECVFYRCNECNKISTSSLLLKEHFTNEHPDSVNKHSTPISCLGIQRFTESNYHRSKSSNNKLKFTSSSSCCLCSYVGDDMLQHFSTVHCSNSTTNQFTNRTTNLLNLLQYQTAGLMNGNNNINNNNHLLNGNCDGIVASDMKMSDGTIIVMPEEPDDVKLTMGKSTGAISGSRKRKLNTPLPKSGLAEIKTEFKDSQYDYDEDDDFDDDDDYEFDAYNMDDDEDDEDDDCNYKPNSSGGVISGMCGKKNRRKRQKASNTLLMSDKGMGLSKMTFNNQFMGSTETCDKVNGQAIKLEDNHYKLDDDMDDDDMDDDVDDVDDDEEEEDYDEDINSINVHNRNNNHSQSNNHHNNNLDTPTASISGTGNPGSMTRKRGRPPKISSHVLAKNEIEQKIRPHVISVGKSLESKEMVRIADGQVFCVVVPLMDLISAFDTDGVQYLKNLIRNHYKPTKLAQFAWDVTQKRGRPRTSLTINNCPHESSINDNNNNSNNNNNNGGGGGDNSSSENSSTQTLKSLRQEPFVKAAMFFIQRLFQQDFPSNLPIFINRLLQNHRYYLYTSSAANNDYNSIDSKHNHNNSPNIMSPYKDAENRLARHWIECEDNPKEVLLDRNSPRVSKQLLINSFDPEPIRFFRTLVKHALPLDELLHATWKGKNTGRPRYSHQTGTNGSSMINFEELSSDDVLQHQPTQQSINLSDDKRPPLIEHPLICAFLEFVPRVCQQPLPDNLGPIIHQMLATLRKANLLQHQHQQQNSVITII